MPFTGKKPNTINRDHFVAALQKKGLTYVQARKAYSAMLSVISDAVLQGDKINLGKIGVLDPVWHKERELTMGFKRTADNKVEKATRKFTLGPRLKYRFRLYRTFLENNDLRWYDDDI